MRSIFAKCFGAKRFPQVWLSLFPNVPPALQRALLVAVLDYVGNRDLVNRVIEIHLNGDISEIKEYEMPNPGPRAALRNRVVNSNFATCGAASDRATARMKRSALS